MLDICEFVDYNVYTLTFDADSIKKFSNQRLSCFFNIITTWQIFVLRSCNLMKSSDNLCFEANVRSDKSKSEVNLFSRLPKQPNLKTIPYFVPFSSRCQVNFISHCFELGFDTLHIFIKVFASAWYIFLKRVKKELDILFD